MRQYRVVLSGEGYDFVIWPESTNEYECREQVHKDYPGFHIDELVEVF